MTMKPFRIIFYFLPIMIVLAGCGVITSTTNQFSIQETFTNANPAGINLIMGGGNLQVAAAEENGITG